MIKYCIAIHEITLNFPYTLNMSFHQNLTRGRTFTRYLERETPPIGGANGSFPPRARGFPFSKYLVVFFAGKEMENWQAFGSFPGFWGISGIFGSIARVLRRQTRFTAQRQLSKIYVPNIQIFENFKITLARHFEFATPFFSRKAPGSNPGTQPNRESPRSVNKNGQKRSRVAEKPVLIAFLKASACHLMAKSSLNLQRTPQAIQVRETSHPRREGPGCRRNREAFPVLNSLRKLISGLKLKSGALISHLQIIAYIRHSLTIHS